MNYYLLPNAEGNGSRLQGMLTSGLSAGQFQNAITTAIKIVIWGLRVLLSSARPSTHAVPL